MFLLLLNDGDSWKALEKNNHNITLTAKKIKLRYETLIRKMKVLGVR